MISRTLVPRDVKPVKPDELKRAGTRVTTYMDDRMVVPSGPSDAPPLNGKSNIPEHLPLGVLVDRTLVPRGMPVKPIERSMATEEAGAIALEVLDARTVVPAHVNPLTPEEREEFARPVVTAELREVVEPDIFMTGDPNLLIEPEEKHDTKWDNISRIGSIVAHIVLIVFLINVGRIFKTSTPSAEDQARAQQELGNFLYFPPATPTPPPPTPKMPKIDPRLIQPAPPVEKPALPELTPPAPAPQPVKPAPELPEALTPHVTPQTPQPQPPQVAESKPLAPSQLEPIKPQPNAHPNLQLPQTSPGQTLQNQLQDAIKHQGVGGTFSAQGRLPMTPGQGGGASVGNQVTILTPTYGVDFNSYIQRMLNVIYRNWMAVMPESAYLGEQGSVLVTFQINADGSVQAPDPLMERTSSKPPLDNAAMSSIRASNPFEPLPKEFLEAAQAAGHGQSVRFAILFIYCGNVPCPTGTSGR